MREVNKEESKKLLTKGSEHKETADAALAATNINAAVTNYTIAMINFLDALSVNLFGKDLSSDHHEAAPRTLKTRLNQIGVSDFKELCDKCVSVLKLKNLSYLSKEPTKTNARFAKATVEELYQYVQSRWDSSVFFG